MNLTSEWTTDVNHSERRLITHTQVGKCNEYVKKFEWHCSYDVPRTLHSDWAKKISVT
jgi:hypothetical protein